ncbi:hypothetical protein TNCV_4570121 [Trichonephila clavipes]|nr:hypothetical protein TNCV_4570121 [Trichonephila clavipes]
MSFVFGPQELQLLHTVPSIFDGNLFSFLDEFERAPVDLTMPRLNPCVKKSIGPIQPMDLSHVIGPIQHVIGPVQHVIEPVQHVIGPVQHVIGPVQHVIGPVQHVIGPVQHVI